MNMINGHVSHWWRDIGGPPAPSAPLPGATSADVAIVGAGYTGLWTAYYLKKADPRLRVIVLEQRHAGYGASGRNGGWLTNSITGGRARLLRHHPRELVDRFQRTMNETVDEVIRVAEVEGIDAEIRKGGEFSVAYTPAQESRLRSFAAAERSWRHTDLAVLGEAEAVSRIGVSQTRAAAWHPHAARIQPAKLVAGLADAVRRLGVQIFEDTRVQEITPHEVRTTHGVVTANVIVRATEGFTSQLKGLRRAWLPMNSSLIVTEPLSPDVWEHIGWRG